MKEMRKRKSRKSIRNLRPLAAVLGLVIGTLAAEQALGQPASLAAASPNSENGQVTPYPGGKWEPGPAMYGAEVVDDVAVTMDDGVVLRASIAFPTDLQTGK